MNSSIGRQFVPDKHKPFWKKIQFGAAYGGRYASYVVRFDPTFINMQQLRNKGAFADTTFDLEFNLLTGNHPIQKQRHTIYEINTRTN